MVKTNIQDNCENSPKSALVRDFNIAFVNQDKEAVLNFLTDDILWNIVGSDVMKGKEEVSVALDSMMGSDIEELTLDNILSHGDRCASNGSMKLTDNSTLAFADFYKFASHAKDAKIKEITSYMAAGPKS